MGKYGVDAAAAKGDQFCMKKVPMRQFKQDLAKLTDSLKPGQGVQVTQRGKVAAVYSKPPARKIRRPNFLANVKRAGYPPEIGDRLIARLYEAVP